MIDAVIPAVPERSPAKKNAVGRGLAQQSWMLRQGVAPPINSPVFLAERTMPRSVAC
jgi:hypothetical protein